MTDAPSNSPPDKDIADGKILAILSYIIWIVALVVLIIRNNNFALYHAKQAMGLFLAWLVLFIPVMIIFAILGTALASVTKGVGACLIPVVYLALVAGMLFMIVMGVISAANGKTKPLPIIGAFAEKIFAGLKVKA